MKGLTLEQPVYTVSTNKNGAKVIRYDDPHAYDEERLYTFNQDGSATCVSDAWGVKTSAPAGTFKDIDNKNPEDLVNLYSSYQEAKRLDYQA